MNDDQTGARGIPKLWRALDTIDLRVPEGLLSPEEAEARRAAIASLVSIDGTFEIEDSEGPLSPEEAEARRAVIASLVSIDGTFEGDLPIPAGWRKACDAIQKISSAAIEPIWDRYVRQLEGGAYTVLKDKLADVCRREKDLYKHINYIIKNEAEDEIIKRLSAQLDALGFQKEVLAAVLDEETLLGAPRLWKDRPYLPPRGGYGEDAKRKLAEIYRALPKDTSEESRRKATVDTFEKLHGVRPSHSTVRRAIGEL